MLGIPQSEHAELNTTTLLPDKIILLNISGIVEQGTHEELLTKGGLYSELWHLQFSEASFS